jgi:hypothetical protein
LIALRARLPKANSAPLNGVCREPLPARGRQAVDAGAEVHWLDGHPGTHVRRDVDQRAAQNALHSAGRPAKPSPRSSTRPFAPRASAVSTTHVG